ncbi:MAG: PLP-dependent transferase [Polyangiales bacterium]
MTPMVLLPSTFAQQSPGVHKASSTPRTNNPTRQTLERCVAGIEGAQHGIAFGSGCAAMAALPHVASR